jgi:hypothetical protein
MTDKAKELRDGLWHFTGTENWYPHSLVRNVLYTDGVQFVAEKGGAYWLLDEIAFANKFERKVIDEGFQFWKLVVTDNKGVLTCEDGGKNGNRSKVVYEKKIPFTDFPLPEITFYVEFGDENNRVILLPSEH